MKSGDAAHNAGFDSMALLLVTTPGTREATFMLSLTGEPKCR